VAAFTVQTDKFDIVPTENEIEFGKFHGIPALIEYTRGCWNPAGTIAKGVEKLHNGQEDGERAQAVKNVVKRATREEKGKRPLQQIQPSDSEESARTSSSDDEDEEGIGEDSRSDNSSEGGSCWMVSFIHP
jgi:hypothetical protein